MQGISAGRVLSPVSAFTDEEETLMTRGICIVVEGSAAEEVAGEFASCCGLAAYRLSQNLVQIPDLLSTVSNVL